MCIYHINRNVNTLFSYLLCNQTWQRKFPPFANDVPIDLSITGAFPFATSAMTPARAARSRATPSRQKPDIEMGAGESEVERQKMTSKKPHRFGKESENKYPKKGMSNTARIVRDLKFRLQTGGLQ